MQEQVRKERDSLIVEQPVRVAAGRLHRNVARRTADGREHLLTRPRGRVRREARERRQEAHEAREVVDAPAARPGIADVFRIGNRIAEPHAVRRDARCQLETDRS